MICLTLWLCSFYLPWGTPEPLRGRLGWGDGATRCWCDAMCDAGCGWWGGATRVGWGVNRCTSRHRAEVETGAIFREEVVKITKKNDSYSLIMISGGSRGGGRIGRGPPPFFGRFLFFGPIFVIFGRGIEEFGFPAPFSQTLDPPLMILCRVSRPFSSSLHSILENVFFNFVPWPSGLCECSFQFRLWSINFETLSFNFVLCHPFSSTAIQIRRSQ